MKMMKKLALLLAALMLVLSFTACQDKSSGKDNDKEDSKVTTTKPLTDEERILGTWEAEINLMDYMKEKLSSSEFLDYFTDDFIVKFVFDFDETKMTMNLGDSFKDDLKKYMSDAINKYLEATVAEQAESRGMTVEEVYAELESQIGMSVEEYMEQTADIDSIVDQMFSEIEGKTSKECYYVLKDGKIYTGDTQEVATDEADIEYEFDGEELKFKTLNEDSPITEYTLKKID